MYFSITKVLKDHGITQVELAKRLDVSNMSVTNYVKGNPTVDTLEKIANAIGANVIEFFLPMKKDDPLVSTIIHQFE